MTSEDYYRQRCEHKLLTAKEEASLFKRLEEGDTEAEETLVLHNQRLVYHGASKWQGNGIPFMDLVQAGNIGLLIAIRKFKYFLGYKFSTYAVPWIGSKVQRAVIHKSRMIKIPHNIQQKYFKIKKFEDNYRKRNGKSPSEYEISENMDIPVADLVFIKNSMDKGDTFSVDNYIDRSKRHTFKYFFYKDRKKEMENRSKKEERKRFIQKLIKDLPKRQKVIIVNRYGLSDGHPKTLERVGEMLGISGERVRQLQDKAEKRIRRRRCQISFNF